MFRQLIFWTLLGLTLISGIAVPCLWYIQAGGANAEWTLASFIASNVPSIVSTLMIVFLITFKDQILGAPRKH